jgi:hypothetical protein
LINDPISQIERRGFVFLDPFDIYKIGKALIFSIYHWFPEAQILIEKNH